MINVAILGLGRIGKMHGENLFFHNKFKIKYVYDIDQNLTKNIKKFNAIQLITENSVQRQKLDLVFIASSTPTHIKFIEEAAKGKNYFVKNH